VRFYAQLSTPAPSRRLQYYRTDELADRDAATGAGAQVADSVPLRYPDGLPPDVERQLKHKLRLIAGLGYAPYFLTVNNIVCYARSKDILCQGRGSAVNSAVCYVVGVTSIDPVRSGLLFERFICICRIAGIWAINGSRASWPTTWCAATR